MLLHTTGKLEIQTPDSNSKITADVLAELRSARMGIEIGVKEVPGCSIAAVSYCPAFRGKLFDVRTGADLTGYGFLEWANQVIESVVNRNL